MSGKRRKPKHVAKHRKPSVIGRILAFRRRSHAAGVHYNEMPRSEANRQAIRNDVDAG